MKPKSTICLWFVKDTHETARLYTVNFPHYKVTAVHKVPRGSPAGKQLPAHTAPVY
jgi:predicted 3-demethylubiquinone-9 3-methyltransferase (glyoxalase superfamily)